MRMAPRGANPIPVDFCSEVFRVLSLPIFPHKMLADEKACEEKGDLQLDSPWLQTSQMHRLRICRCGSYLSFQKLLVLLWSNYDATSLCYCPTAEVTVSVGRRGKRRSALISKTQTLNPLAEKCGDCWCLKWITLAVLTVFSPEQEGRKRVCCGSDLCYSASLSMGPFKVWAVFAVPSHGLCSAVACLLAPGIKQHCLI